MGQRFSLRKPTRLQEQSGKKKCRPAPFGMTVGLGVEKKGRKNPPSEEGGYRLVALSVTGEEKSLRPEGLSYGVAEGSQGRRIPSGRLGCGGREGPDEGGEFENF